MCKNFGCLGVSVSVHDASGTCAVAVLILTSLNVGTSALTYQACYIFSADAVQPVTLHVYSNSQTRGENTRRSGRHVLAAHAFTGRVFFSISLNRTCQRQDLSQDKLVGEWRSALAKLREQVLPPLTDTTRLQIPATSQKRCVSHCRRTWAYAWP